MFSKHRLPTTSDAEAPHVALQEDLEDLYGENLISANRCQTMLPIPDFPMPRYCNNYFQRNKKQRGAWFSDRGGALLLTAFNDYLAAHVY